jgi:hypothetical protein
VGTGRGSRNERIMRETEEDRKIIKMGKCINNERRR